MRWEEVRIQFKRLLKLFNSAIILAREVEDDSRIRVDGGREWIKLLCSFQMWHDFIESPERDQVCISLLNIHRVWIKLQGSFTFLLGG